MLNKTLNLTDLTIIGVGNIIGGGIFTLISNSTKYSKGYTWLSFLISGIIIYLSSSSYKYLSSYFTKAEAEYNIIEKYFGDNMAKMINISLIFSIIFIVSTIAIGFSEYFSNLFNIKDKKNIIASIIILLCGFINFLGIRESMNVMYITTFLECLVLIIISMIGIFNLDIEKLSVPPKNVSNIIMSSFLIMFAYNGFETLPRLSEETIDSKNVIPQAINNSVFITTILYTLVAMAVISILGVNNVIASKTPLADVFKKIIGNNSNILISIIALISIANTMLVSNISASRSLYGLANKIPSLKIFRQISNKNKTPTISIIFVTILSIICMYIFENIEKLARYANYFVFIVLLFINFAAIKKNYNDNRTYDPITILGAISIIFYMIFIPMIKKM